MLLGTSIQSAASAPRWAMAALLLGALWAPISAQADSATGSIASADLNALGPQDRSLCLQLQPAMSGTGWACLYKNNALYKEILSTLLMARAAQMSCTVFWSYADAEGHKVIEHINC
jgi:hypothetical protein